MLDTETMSTTVIFLALLLSLSALAWWRPTSLNSLRAIPSHGPSLPTHNTAIPVHSTATPARSVSHSGRLWSMWVLFYHWWAHVSNTGIYRNPAIVIVHHEPTVFSAARVSAQVSSAGIRTEVHTRSPSFTTFAPTSESISGAPSIINTIVDNEVIELHMLGGKGPSTSSFAVTDNADTADTHGVMLSATEPIAHTDVSALSEATNSSSTTEFHIVES
ncbi:uncharacterized protein EDB91DRAFT_1164911 [Suillus paluster]|uniref:uncharacterized protein n=1 Tax=Suillus paluster TaxID=48578 RepID=UPI001B87EFBD|nr:uncharacterized protein EDB91DRAFT_1164911 [Suillus paluster]KAG1727064.1 hypothetical protein EDB91DRAFT_1164911 [Suillus paluster]